MRECIYINITFYPMFFRTSVLNRHFCSAKCIIKGFFWILSQAGHFIMKSSLPSARQLCFAILRRSVYLSDVVWSRTKHITLWKLFTSGDVCVNHDRNMFILIMIKTASRDSFDHDQTKHVKKANYAGEGECPKDPKLGLLWDQMLR